MDQNDQQLNRLVVTPIFHDGRVLLLCQAGDKIELRTSLVLPLDPPTKDKGPNAAAPTDE